MSSGPAEDDDLEIRAAQCFPAKPAAAPATSGSRARTGLEEAPRRPAGEGAEPCGPRRAGEPGSRLGFGAIAGLRQARTSKRLNASALQTTRRTAFGRGRQ